jgi:hypothetical protein
MIQTCKTKWKGIPAEDRISELKDEMVIKGKTRELLNNSRLVKIKCKNSLIHQKNKLENHGH